MVTDALLRALKRAGAGKVADWYVQSVHRREWLERDRDIVETYLRSRDSPSRKQFIDLVRSEVRKPDGRDFVFFEFGCNIGINLEILHAIYGDDGFAYYGCDINKHCIDYMNETYRWARGFHASDETIRQHMDELPGHIDLFLSKSSLGYINDDGIDRLIRLFASRTGAFVIGDSTEMMDADRSSMQDYYFLHPYRKVMVKHSFEITRYEAVTAERGKTNTGMFVARKVGVRRP